MAKDSKIRFKPDQLGLRVVISNRIQKIHYISVENSTLFVLQITEKTSFEYLVLTSSRYLQINFFDIPKTFPEYFIDIPSDIELVNSDFFSNNLTFEILTTHNQVCRAAHTELLSRYKAGQTDAMFARMLAISLSGSVLHVRSASVNSAKNSADFENPIVMEVAVGGTRGE